MNSVSLLGSNLTFKGKFEKIIKPEEEKEVKQLLKEEGTNRLASIQNSISQMEKDTIELLPKDDIVQLEIKVEKYEKTFQEKMLDKIRKFKSEELKYLVICLKYLPGEESKSIGMKMESQPWPIDTYPINISFPECLANGIEDKKRKSECLDEVLKK